MRHSRVLLVDDDRMLLRALADVLQRRLDTAIVEPCNSPLTALTALAEEDFDVVVSDLLMDGLDGLELLQRVKAMRPASLVVLITGAADRDLSVRALRGGAYDFIQKPVDADYLVASVRRAIETRRLRAELERHQVALQRHAQDLEQTVAERTEELRRANRSKDEFLATISHELRTPLTAVLGWARLLCGGRLDAEERALAVESIARNARSQAQLIDDLLDVSRIITGKLRLDLQPVDLAAVLDGAIGVILPAAQAKNIEIDSQIEEGAGAVSGDPDRLQQVLWNLLSNAVKFTPAGGRIVVRGRARGGGVELAVSDNGLGIDPEFLPYVFDRFRQGESNLSSRRGLGLGLAIVRHLVELHGGTVTASSDGQGKGATFTVTLPFASREVTAPPPRKRSKAPSSYGRVGNDAMEPCLRGLRVLVVDDEADTRQVLQFMLEHAGAKVETAGSASEAREAFRRAPPDVLLCDIGLGCEDGYGFMREVRALPDDQGGCVRAVALTGYAKTEDRDRALAAGFELHVAKPGPPDLPAMVARLVATSAPPRNARPRARAEMLTRGELE